MVTAPLPDDLGILSVIADIAAKHLDWHGAVSRDMPLLETFELDSLRQLTLVVEIEDRFRIRLDDRDEESIVTVGDLVDTIRRKRAAAAADVD
jgi:acyl carrier protein